ncbi:MAG: hypothetical protein K1X67_17880 [Fimbriimonadaceae bacterium]|nr:hypothetical protein [Fimbriimonadaceae bacterium]
MTRIRISATVSMLGLVLSVSQAQLSNVDVLISCGESEFDSSIERFTTTGSSLGTFFSSPDLMRPGGMAVTADGQVLIASQGTYQLITIDPYGSMTNILGPLSDGSLVFPSDIIATGGGHVISDGDGGALRFLDTNLATIVEAGEFGSSAAHMVRRNNMVYASDTPNARVWSLDLVTGATQLVVSGNGLIGPTGLALDSLGRLIIADGYQSRLYRWDGLALTTLAAGPPLDSPRGLTVAPNGTILVANEGDGSILRFSMAGTYLSTFATGLVNPTHILSYRLPHPGNGFALLEFCEDPTMSSLYLEFRRPATGVLAELIGPISVDAGGYFSFGVQLDGVFNVYARAPHYLRKYVGQFNTSTLFGLSFSLTNGDCDGDNEVGIGDYALLSAAYSTTSDEAGYDNRADLNCDEAVDIGDYAILSMNYGQIGD